MVATQHARISFQSLTALALFAALAASLQAQTSFPQITHVFPAVVQKGATAEVSLFCEASTPANPIAVLFEGKGITAKPLVAKGNSLKFQVTVAADAVAGLREFRLAAGSGASTVGQILVSDFPVVAEQTNPHIDFSSSQAIKLNSVVSGLLSAREQVDAYKFTAQAGQTLAFSVTSHCFFFKKHSQFLPIDPLISLYDATGREIAANDDFHFADPSLIYKFTSPGDYLVVVRDVDYQASAIMPYNLTLTAGPLVNWAYPLAHPLSQPAAVRAGGANLPDSNLNLQPVSQDFSPGVYPHAQIKTSLGYSNAFAIFRSSLPIQEELALLNKPLSFPSVVNGRILKQGESDTYSLSLKKGDKIKVEIQARRLGSQLDSFLSLNDDKGRVLASNDDLANSTKDSGLQYAATADIAVKITVRDLLNRGGLGFNYALVVDREEPDFSFTCDDDKAGIPAGSNAAWYIRLRRGVGFQGPVEFTVSGLPPGVTVAPLVISEGLNDGCLILQAAPQAALGAALVQITGKAKSVDAKGNQVTLVRPAQPLTELKMPGGGRSTWPVTTQIVAVTKDRDITSVKVDQEKITLKPGESVTIEVEILRDANYQGRVTLDVIHRHLGAIFGNPLPAGVTVVDAGGKTALSEKESKGKIILKAAPDMKPVPEFPITVLANVSLNFTVKRGYASKPILLSVAP